MSAPRILMTADTIGGVWHYATDLVAGLAEQGIGTVLATLGPPATPVQREVVARIAGATLVETGLPLDWVVDEPAPVIAAGDVIARLATEVQADLVHLNVPALAARARFGVPVVAAAHGCIGTWWRGTHATTPPAPLAWHDALTSDGLNACARSIAPSAAFARDLGEAYALTRPPAVVHNGRRILPPPPRAMHDFAFTAGRLWDRAKDARTLDRAAARLSIPLRAAGAVRGPHDEVVQLEHMHPLGQLDDAGIAAQLSARPVFVSAARYEPFGLAVLEAAAAGCAMVLSDIPTFRELWDDTALFVTPGDDPGFAAAVDAIVGDGARRLALGHAAQRRARRYTIEAMTAGTIAVYRAAGLGGLAPQAMPIRRPRAAA